MNLVEIVGDQAATVELAIAGAALVGLIWYAAAPALLAAWPHRTLVIRHGRTPARCPAWAATTIAALLGASATGLILGAATAVIHRTLT